MFVLYYTISELFAYDSPACVNYWKIMEKEGIKRKVFLSKSRQEKNRIYYIHILVEVPPLSGRYLKAAEELRTRN